MQEEIFGPVFILHRFGYKSSKNAKDKGFKENELLDVLNNSKYGLTGGLYSKDKKMMSRIAKQMETGSIFFNKVGIAMSEVPVGGVKHSGFGRECGEHSLGTFSTIKTSYENIENNVY